MTTDAHRIKLLKELLAERILVLDGAFGTFVLGENLSAADYGGARYEGCNENVVRTRPDLIRRMHDGFLEVGADIIETASFQASPIVLAEYGLEPDTRELNRLAATLAREQAAKFSTADKPRFVAGSMGPTTKSISVTGGVTFDQMRDGYQVQAEGLIEGGADILLLETVNDTLNCKAGLVAIEAAIAKLGVAPAVARVGNDRDDGHSAQRPGHRGLLYFARASRPALDGPQLRDRPRLHDRSSAHAVGHLEILRRVRAQRGPARRRRPLQ